MTLTSSADKPSKTFDELMSTPIDFSAFSMNGLKINNLTQETLLGLAFRLLKGTCSNYVKLEYDFKECYKALSVKLDMENLEGVVTQVEVMRKHGYGYLKEIVVRRANNDPYRFKEGNFPRLRINDIEDMLLLVVQNRLTNLLGDDVFDFVITLRMFTRSLVMQKRVEDLQLGVESYQKKINVIRPQTTISGIRKRDPYTPYQDPQGFIYVNNNGRNTDDITKSIRMEYLPKRRWSTLEKKRANIMIKAIDKEVERKKVMSSLKKYVWRNASTTELT
ncbi:hypothetical protein Tco_0832432 [Tanacetum coccineum]